MNCIQYIIFDGFGHKKIEEKSPHRTFHTYVWSRLGRKLRIWDMNGTSQSMRDLVRLQRTCTLVVRTNCVYVTICNLDYFIIYLFVVWAFWRTTNRTIFDEIVQEVGTKSTAS